MRALVTGARGGIGGAVVTEFLAAGYEVLAQDIRPARQEEDRPGLTHLTGDLLDPGFYEELVRELGDAPLDSVVVAHGTGKGFTIDSTTEAEARRTLELNFLAVVRLFEVVRDRLRAGAGSFVTVASQAGLVGEANMSSYSASKSAIIGWTEAVASRPEAEGVRMRAVCPGCVDTELLAAAFTEVADEEDVPYEAVVARRVEAIPLGRLSSTREQAAGILWLSRARSPRPIVMANNAGEVLH